MGVGRPWPPVRDDNVTPQHLFPKLNINFFLHLNIFHSCIFFLFLPCQFAPFQTTAMRTTPKCLFVCLSASAICKRERERQTYGQADNQANRGRKHRLKRIETDKTRHCRKNETAKRRSMKTYALRCEN